ncbi:MAG: hypothetical protein UY48_C0013G0010 [Candidatus Gottesmanbacteria bacterium GW2011_GWB1_49_7]|uniref:Uncharacterized protein n=1 Tax=Candidatus Gottesmanbacteria bacterium GW2011_GWB1_49_7 TaxID=1618448 RepID=A0A0G1YZC6_9BACT|nr:MAG: hypothetical protein UY48_C0013G0010 [Candidatus Gottesmanbacteria bacterium GW2011_GWB1_49_7]
MSKKLKRTAGNANKLPNGYVLQCYEAQSLWQGGGWDAKCVCVPSGEKPIIDSPGNLYIGPKTWDIERKSDIGNIRMGLRTKSIDRAISWKKKRESPGIPAEWLREEIMDAINRRRGGRK